MRDDTEYLVQPDLDGLYYYTEQEPSAWRFLWPYTCYWLIIVLALAAGALWAPVLIPFMFGGTP